MIPAKREIEVNPVITLTSSRYILIVENGKGTEETAEIIVQQLNYRD